MIAYRYPPVLFSPYGVDMMEIFAYLLGMYAGGLLLTRFMSRLVYHVQLRSVVNKAVLLLALALLTAGCGGTSGSSAPAAPSPPAASQQAQEPQGGPQPSQQIQELQGKTQPSPQGAPSLIPAAVVETVDGDTVVVRLGDGRTEKVRFIGVDTPETHHPTVGEEPYGREAASFTAKSLNGRTVWLETDAQERDQYGRLLAYVWLAEPRDGSEAEVRAKMFNARLLLEGYAQVLTVPPNVKYADLFAKLQREAREQGRGLWGLPVQGNQGKAGQGGKQGGNESYYIGNMNSKKFHRPDCEWAAKIAPGNRVYFATREEALRQGYEPCKVCRP